MPFKPNESEKLNQQKSFDKKEKIKEYEKKEPLFDDDYIEKQLQEELLKERESTDDDKDVESHTAGSRFGQR